MKIEMQKNRLMLTVKKYSKLLVEHGRTVYFVLFLSVVIGAVAGLNTILSQPSDEKYRTEKLNETQSPRFDTATIEKIKKLNAGQQTNTDEPTSGSRSNPFGE